MVKQKQKKAKSSHSVAISVKKIWKSSFPDYYAISLGHKLRIVFIANNMIVETYCIITSQKN